MSGLSRNTATLITADEHLEQSISDILTTPLGTRVMRREYGSELPRLIDAPINGETVIDLFQATAEALARWEPRFSLQRVEVLDAEAGFVDLRLTGIVSDLETALQIRLGAAA